MYGGAYIPKNCYVVSKRRNRNFTRVFNIYYKLIPALTLMGTSEFDSCKVYKIYILRFAIRRLPLVYSTSCRHLIYGVSQTEEHHFNQATLLPDDRAPIDIIWNQKNSSLSYSIYLFVHRSSSDGFLLKFIHLMHSNRVWRCNWPRCWNDEDWIKRKISSINQKAINKSNLFHIPSIDFSMMVDFIVWT